MADEYIVRNGTFEERIPGWDPRSDYSREITNRMATHSEGLFETWRDLATMKPPDDIFGKIFWFLGVIGQLILSLLIYPASLGAFLMEETVQTAGMGAYVLSSSRNYDLLYDYLGTYLAVIDAAREGATNLTILSPIVGGAALQYMDAAYISHRAFYEMTVRKLAEQAEKDEELRLKLEQEQIYGDLRLSSSPSLAQIYMNGTDTQYLTPQTFKNLDAGAYRFEVRKWNTKTDGYDTYNFTVTIEAGRRKEIHVRIPRGETTEETHPDQTDGSDADKLPLFLKAEVEGDYAVDGDTFQTITGERIRVMGIDAPELGQPWADVAQAYLDDLIHGKNVSLRIQSSKPIDTHGRTLALCKMYKGDIGELMLMAGLARTFFMDDDMYDHTSYQLAEDMAKQARRGIWGGLP